MNLFTVSKFRYPKYIEDTIRDYTFYYESPSIFEEFYKQNSVEDIDFALFTKINNVFIKKLCFIFYVLYVKGGFFIDLNVIPGEDLNIFLIEDNYLYCVESILKNNTLFLGIFGSSSKNKTLLNLMHSFIEFDKNNSSISSNDIYTLIKQTDKQITYLNEKMLKKNCISTITDTDLVLFDHYYDPKISYIIPFENKIIQQPTDIKIGITLLLFKDINSFFSNGINQNSLFLCELLLNCGFDVYFIVEDEKLFDINAKTLNNILYDSRFKYKKYSEILYSEFNVIITLSYSYGDIFIYNYLKHMNTKHIGYFCGNTYIIETEKILYNQHKLRQNDPYEFTINGYEKYDQIWSIPQMSSINLDFWCILYRCKCIEVPFVWSSSAITLFCKANNSTEEEFYYKNRGSEKKIAILEPNISIMKWALPAILICEDSYRTNQKIKHLYITNINSSNTNDFNLNQFNKLVKNLDIVKENKCSIETRYKTLQFMKDHADIVISHQWGNPLNYLYFDLAWMGWPIIHNAYLCKDIGYFYDNFNLKDGSTILNQVIETHDLNKDQYLINNRKAIERFLSTNKDLQKIYSELIFSLFDI